MVYELGEIRVDAATFTASVRGASLSLGPKVVRVLVSLCEAAGEVVARDALIAAAWPCEVVDESSLWQTIYVLRKVLAANGAQNTIENLRARGYRLTGRVGRLSARAPAPRRADRAVWLALLMALSLVAFSSPVPSPPRSTLTGESGRLLRVARFYFDSQTADGLQRSEAILTRLVRREPRSAPAFSALADTESTLVWAYGPSPSARLALRRARAASDAALHLEPGSAEAVASHASVAEALAGRFGVADAAYERSLALDPHDWRAQEQYAVSLMMRGRLDDAVAHLRSAAALDPTTAGVNAWLSLVYYLKHEPAPAALFAAQALYLGDDPDDSRARLGMIYAMEGNAARAVWEFTALRRCCPQLALAYIAQAYAQSGDPLRARSVLRRVHAGGDSAQILWLNIAFAHVLLHERDAALRSLRHVLLGDPMERALIALDPRLDSVRGDPRFARFVRLQ